MDGDSFGGATEPTMYLSLPSALEFECMAHTKINLDMVCDTSPRIWGTLNSMMLHRGGYTTPGSCLVSVPRDKLLQRVRLLPRAYPRTAMRLSDVA
jgi:hypothetical protein